MAVTAFKKQMDERGWFVFEGFFSASLIEKMIHDLESAYKTCRKIQLESWLNNTEGTCHHLIGQKNSFLTCLRDYERLNEYLEAYFDGKYILNSFGGNILTGSSYASHIHRDIRSFSGDLPLMLNTLVMLDEFTTENGATRLMEAGHKLKDKPSEEDFYSNSFQITGKPGTLVMWNSNLWHSAEVNRTDKARRSITPIFAKPFIKSGLDYPRLMGYERGAEFSPYMRQVLGYNSRIPATLAQWYKPVEQRFYRSDQQ